MDVGPPIALSLRRAGAAFLYLLLLGVPAAAQTPPVRDPDPDETLRLTLTPYGVIQQFSGSVDDTRPTVGDTATPFESGAIAVGGLLEVRLDKTAARFDLQYSNSDTLASRRDPSEEGSTFSRALVLDALIGYRLLERERQSLELYVGVRIAYLGRITAIALAADGALHKSEVWGSGVVGARVIQPLGTKWYLDAGADVGGQVRDAFGASHTWSFDLAAARAMSSRFEFIGGYQALYEWRDHTPLRFHLGLKGPFAGIRWLSSRRYP